MKVVSPRGRPLGLHRSPIEKRINRQISAAGLVGGTLSLGQAWALGDDAWRGAVILFGLAVVVAAVGLGIWLARLRTFGTLKTYPQTRLSLRTRHLARAAWIVRFGLFGAFTLLLLSAGAVVLLGMSGGTILFHAAITVLFCFGIVSSAMATVANLDLIRRARHRPLHHAAARRGAPPHELRSQGGAGI